MDYVTDTHALVWYFTEDERLSTVALKAFDETIIQGQIIVPAVVLAEILYIVKRGKIGLTFGETLQKIDNLANFQVVPLDTAVLTVADQLNVNLEMHDLLIVATARFYEASLITKDEEIQKTGLVTVIW
jgi:PIN domain nuclease of toxin-antitoxin system